jgi:hypothetical protein
MCVKHFETGLHVQAHFAVWTPVYRFLFFCKEQTTQHLWGFALFPVAEIFSVKCFPKSLSGGGFIDGLPGPAGLVVCVCEDEGF